MTQLQATIEGQEQVNLMLTRILIGLTALAIQQEEITTTMRASAEILKTLAVKLAPARAALAEAMRCLHHASGHWQAVSITFSPVTSIEGQVVGSHRTATNSPFLLSAPSPAGVVRGSSFPSAVAQQI